MFKYKYSSLKFPWIFLDMLKGMFQTPTEKKKKTQPKQNPNQNKNEPAEDAF